jgi:hypothetical protein
MFDKSIAACAVVAALSVGFKYRGASVFVADFLHCRGAR